MSADAVAAPTGPAPGNGGGTAKPEMLAALGETPLVLPALINRALVANDQAKYLMSLLQAARMHADRLDEPYSDLHEERLAAGLGEAALDQVVAGAQRDGPDWYSVPRARDIHDRILAAAGEMLAPIEAAGGDPALGPDRLRRLVEGASGLDGDRISGSYLDAMTAAGGTADSIHRLILDAHRALNRLQAEVATADLDGAAVYRLGEGDEELVRAFMAGLHETAPLKFDHPGLGTTATRAGGRLLLQNDLGTTGAHVFVVAVEAAVAHLTYTDIHRRRAAFFQGMLAPYPVQWSRAEQGSGPGLGKYVVVSGRHVAPDRAALAEFLRHLGSRLVFVLDWNRARKRLTPLVGAEEALQVLRWAAEENVGHRAFLQLGGERLVYDAVELAAKVPARYGEPLREVLGQEATVAVVRFSMEAATRGLLAGKSQLLIRDEVRVEVLRHVQASHRRLLEAGADHASRIVQTAQLLQRSLMRLGTSGEALRGAVARAGRWEHEADDILSSVRLAARRVEGGNQVVALVAEADDAIDALEEATFLLTVLPSTAVETAVPSLHKVTALAAATAREFLKAVLEALEVLDGGAADDLEDFLVAVDRVASLEHEADDEDRTARAALVAGAPDFRSLHVADRLAQNVESSSDALMRAVLRLRDHVLAQVGAP